MTKKIAIEDSIKDYLTIQEINSRIVKRVRPDLLYRTHMALHRDAKDSTKSKKIVKAHKIVADEMLERSLMHHQWDRLDSIYSQ